MKKICGDLEEEYREFDDLVSGLDSSQWRIKTPFYRWTVFDEVAHIAFFDHEALLALGDVDQFKNRAKGVMTALVSDTGLRAHTNRLLDIDRPWDLLAFWRDTRTRMIKQLKGLPSDKQIPWYGPDMKARSFAMARLMETWAHSQDVFDALSLKRVNTARLYHVAEMGVKTFAWSFYINKCRIPQTRPRVELISPFGEKWVWGPPDTGEMVWGSAEEFCLVVAQRRNLADTCLKWSGHIAGRWLSMAQVFAGVLQHPPEPGYFMTFCSPHLNDLKS